MSNPKIESNLITLYLNNQDFIHLLFKYNLVNFSLTPVDDKGNTLLHHMIYNKDYVCIELLLNHITNINNESYKKSVLDAQNDAGNTPLHLAVINGLQDVAKKLDKCGADVTIPNNDDLVIRLSDSEARSEARSVSRNRSRSSSRNRKSESLEQILQKLLVPKQNNLEDSSEIDTLSIFEKLPGRGKRMTGREQRMTRREEPMLMNSSEVDTNKFLEFIMNQRGGQNQEINGSRKLKKSKKSVNSVNSDTASDSLGIAQLLTKQIGGIKHSRKYSSRSSRSAKSSRSTKSKKLSSRDNNPSSIIHNEVIEIIKKMGFSEDDARYIKAGIYNEVKVKFENLSNVQRALKMKELTTSDKVKTVAKDLPKLKEAVNKAREMRKAQDNNQPKDQKEKEDKKVKKDKKEKK